MDQASTQPAFRIERGEHRGRDFDLVYRENDRRLDLYLELTGGLFAEFDYVGAGGDFECWSIPQGEEIPLEHRRLVQARVREWGIAHGMRLDWGSSLSRAEDEMVTRQQLEALNHETSTFFQVLRLFLFGRKS